MLLSLNSALFVVLKSDSEMTKAFFHICEASAKDTRAMFSCLLELLVQLCTRANFAQHLLLMNLFIYAIVLIAILHKPYILLTSNISCISINYLRVDVTKNQRKFKKSRTRTENRFGLFCICSKLEVCNKVKWG